MGGRTGDATKRRSRPRIRRCLAPVVGERPRVLILGSMPGEESLRRQQYYAHPQNQLWRILGELIGARREIAYAARIALARRAGIALWDVAAECRRVASSDASMRAVRGNKVAALLRSEPTIELVLCNGATSHGLFTRLVAAELPRAVRVLRMPSTSPAHAGMPYREKLARWRRALRLVAASSRP